MMEHVRARRIRQALESQSLMVAEFARIHGPLWSPDANIRIGARNTGLDRGLDWV